MRRMAATSTCATRSCATPAVRGAVAAGARVFADLSKNRWDLFTRKLLIELAHECGMPARRDAMSGGEPVNITEGRSVLHTALRVPRGLSPHSDEVHAVLDAMFAFAERVRHTAASGVRDGVNFGIGPIAIDR